MNKRNEQIIALIKANTEKYTASKELALEFLEQSGYRPVICPVTKGEHMLSWTEWGCSCRKCHKTWERGQFGLEDTWSRYADKNIR